MIISGLQKLTLLDYPGRVAATVFLGGCNFRCPFCHNATLVKSPSECEAIEDKKLLSFLETRRGILDGVCITGGEPLLRDDIGSLISDIKSLGFAVKIDTNGSRPEMLDKLLSTGVVDMVAMDIKAAPDNYTLATATKIDIGAIDRSIRLIMEKAPDYEFRTTYVKPLHSEWDVIEIAKWISGARAYYIQNFKDSGDLINGNGFSPFSDEELTGFLELARKYAPNSHIRGDS